MTDSISLWNIPSKHSIFQPKRKTVLNRKYTLSTTGMLRIDLYRSRAQTLDWNSNCCTSSPVSSWNNLARQCFQVTIRPPRCVTLPWKPTFTSGTRRVTAIEIIASASDYREILRTCTWRSQSMRYLTRNGEIVYLQIPFFGHSWRIQIMRGRMLKLSISEPIDIRWRIQRFRWRMVEVTFAEQARGDE